jgi:hypothetical protein
MKAQHGEPATPDRRRFDVTAYPERRRAMPRSKTIAFLAVGTGLRIAKDADAMQENSVADLEAITACDLPTR